MLVTCSPGPLSMGTPKLAVVHDTEIPDPRGGTQGTEEGRSLSCFSKN